ncbi:MAG: FG-GAP repeat protein [Bacteroidota bacterium]
MKIKTIALGSLTGILLNCYFLQAQNLGIGTSSPGQKLHVNGKIKVADDATTPSAGTIRWNSTSQDFEGFNGTQWLSLTAGSTNTQGTSSDLGRLKDYTAIGNPIPVTNDRMGSSVDISGEWAVVGCRSEGVAGAIHVYKRVGIDWLHQQKLTPAVITAGGAFGGAVAIDGNYLIAGSYADETNGNVQQGAAWIFFYNGVNWVEQQKLINTTGVADEWFGESVDISGDIAVVGAPQADDLANVDEGKAFAFKRNGTVWGQTGVFTGSGGSAGDYFGNSVAIDNGYFVVGAPFYRTGGITMGAAHTYFFNGTSWTIQTKLLASDQLSGDLFGISVAINGSTALIGCRDKTTSFTDDGAAYIYTRSGTIWTQRAKLLAPDGHANANFGWSVSISGDYCIVGTPNHYRQNACGTNVTSSEGQAYVFKKMGAIWENYLVMTLPRGQSGDLYGHAVSIDGLYVSATAPNADANGLAESGKVIFGKLE